MEWNKYQSTIEQLNLDSYPDEVVNEFYEFINTVPFIKNLISKDRPLCKDVPRDENGRAIIDLTNPPIIENVDYFRQAAIKYQKTGRYTDLRPNPNPNSEYGKWNKQEVMRCWYGMVRPEDGAWVSGDMYFFLNYSPIIQSKIRKGTKVADRVIDFPEWWEGIYYRSVYQEMARNNAHHCAEIAKRGAGKSFWSASQLSRNFILGENYENQRSVRSMVMAYQKEYLTKDGTLNKFSDMRDFLAKATQWPHKTLTKSLDKMQWRIGEIDLNTGAEIGTKNEVLGISSKDDPDKGRGKRSSRIIIEEFGNFPKIIDTYRVMLPSVQEGDIVFGQMSLVGTGGSEGNDFAGAQEILFNPLGYNIQEVPNVYDKSQQSKGSCIFFFPAYLNRKGCYNEDGISDVTKALLEICYNRYLVKYNSTDPMALTRTKAENPVTLQEAIMRRDSTIFPVASIMDRIEQIKNEPTFYDDVLSGDLVMKQDGKITCVPSTRIPIRHFPHKDNKLEGCVEIFKLPEYDSNGKPMSNRYISGCLKKGELVNTSDGLKKVEDITINDKLINIDGEEVDIINLQKHFNDRDFVNIKLKGIIDGTSFTWNHPIFCCTPKRKYNGIKKVKSGFPERYYEYNFRFKNAEDVKVGDVVKSPNIYTKVKSFMHKWSDDGVRIDNRIENPLNNEDFWWMIGLLLGDGWAAGNGYKIECSFNVKEKQFYEKFESVVTRLFGRVVHKRINYCGSCIELSFSCKQLNEFFADNFGVGAENKNIPEWVKYIPANLKKQLVVGYLSADGCISNNVCDIVSVSKKLLCDIQDILFSLGVVSSIKILRREKIHTFCHDGKIYECNTRETYQLSFAKISCQKVKEWSHNNIKLSKVSDNNDFNDHNIKNIWIDDNNKYIYFKVGEITSEKSEEVVYNFECDTHTFMCNYIPTHNCDPYDDDSSKTMSLGSIFILDLFTDEIVAEYTGRPTFAEDFYEICRKLLLMYNARCNYENNKKGCFSYFSKMNCLYLLTDTLEFLKDKDDAVGSIVTNKSKGTNATQFVNNYGRRLIRDWLIKPTSIITSVNGEDVETTVPSLMKIRNIALLQELSQWNPDGNFDRVSAMGMLMLLREDRLRLLGPQGVQTDRFDNDDNLANDEFFTKNFGNIPDVN